ncbi:MAG: aspartate aminotransferase family protein [Deltaproteobacteria bacterium CG11_big_fil_rev_8_21_14_0_20_45_16]|nr:MAG: aspartate aminotransferase family protein [Deltaproteobacteria bacterium CG11_big_fil_rev_8_21_14_0_20_45_16]
MQIKSSELIESCSHFFTPNYRPADFVLSHGLGSYLYDMEGKEYLDFSSGIAVNNLGHCHPRITEAVKNQASKLLHCSNLFWNYPAMKLAKRLCELSFADQVLFLNSGSEANEAALKLARKYFFDQGMPRSKILAFEGGFHGRTMGSLSATAKKAFREPFEPLVPGFEFATFNDESSISKIDKTFAAVILEPVQGEAGVYPAEEGFVRELRKRCDETSTLLIMDCIQTGMYRTDCLFGYESFGIEPDIVTLSKALGGGLPLGAMLTKEEIGKSFNIGAHGTTFGGNPVSAAAANAILDVLTDNRFDDERRRLVHDFGKMVYEKISKLPKVKSLRLKGLMLGIDLDVEDITPVFDKLRKHGILVTRIAPRSLRILPPLIAAERELRFFADGLSAVLN